MWTCVLFCFFLHHSFICSSFNFAGRLTQSLTECLRTNIHLNDKRMRAIRERDDVESCQCTQFVHYYCVCQTRRHGDTETRRHRDTDGKRLRAGRQRVRMSNVNGTYIWQYISQMTVVRECEIVRFCCQLFDDSLCNYRGIPTTALPGPVWLVFTAAYGGICITKNSRCFNLFICEHIFYKNAVKLD